MAFEETQKETLKMKSHLLHGVRIETSLQFLGDLDRVANAHRDWIKENQSSTLIELYSYLLSVETEFDHYDEEERIIDHIDDFNEEASHYVDHFDEVESDFETPVTFAYRRDNLNEDIGHLQELIEEAGVTYPIEKLAPFARLDLLPVE